MNTRTELAFYIEEAIIDWLEETEEVNIDLDETRQDLVDSIADKLYENLQEE